MLVGGIPGYPGAVVIAEDVTLTPVNAEQSILAGVPRLYASAGGQLLAELPFDPTAVTHDTDGVAMIEEAMNLWVAFRHMVRV